MVVPQWNTFFEDEEEVASCPPGLTNALPYATASCLHFEEVRAKGKFVFSPMPSSLTHSATVCCLSIHINNMFSWGSCGLGSLFLVPCGKTVGHTCMCRGPIPNPWGGIERGSGHLGSGWVTSTFRVPTQTYGSDFTTLVNCNYIWFPYHKYLEERTMSRPSLFPIHYLNTWCIINSY